MQFVTAGSLSKVQHRVRSVWTVVPGRVFDLRFSIRLPVDPARFKMNLLKTNFSAAVFLLAALFLPTCIFAEVDFDKFQPESNATYLLEMENGRRYAGRIDKVWLNAVTMTRRCGRIVRPKIADVKSLKKVEDSFTPKTFDQVRAGLVKEFQGKYTVSRTQHFLVVHPPGQFEAWAKPFEKFYANFQAYWRARGVALQDPEFPLVAVVLRTQREFKKIAAKKDIESAGGFFSHDSNRLFTYLRDYDSVGEKRNREYTFDVICHEIAHQLSFNTGLETRGSSSAMWFSEGLAQMFEADGVNDSIKHSSLVSRIHYGELKNYLKLRRNGRTKSIIKRQLNGGLFDRDQNLAYSSAWAMMMFLSESRPRQLAEYAELQRAATQRGSNGWSRTELFEKAFGDVKLLEAHMNNYVDKLAKEVDLAK